MQSVSESILLHLHQDKILSPIIDKCTLTIHKAPLQLFDDLLRSIVSQQLSTKAAATIYDRFLALFDGRPQQVSKTGALSSDWAPRASSIKREATRRQAPR